MCRLFSPVAKKLEDYKENVNKIKVQSKSSGNRSTTSDSFEFLGVVGGKADKDDQADTADHELNNVGMEEYIHDGGNDNADQSHETE